MSKLAALKQCLLDPVWCYVHYGGRHWMMDTHAAWPVPSWLRKDVKRRFNSPARIIVSAEGIHLSEDPVDSHPYYPTTKQYVAGLKHHLNNFDPYVILHTTKVRVVSDPEHGARSYGEKLLRQDDELPVFIRDGYLKGLRSLARKEKQAGKAVLLIQSVPGGEQFFDPRHSAVGLMVERKVVAFCMPLRSVYVKEVKDGSQKV